MLLNSDELTGFVHLPSTAVRSPVFQRQPNKSLDAASIVRLNGLTQNGLLLGENDHCGQSR